MAGKTANIRATFANIGKLTSEKQFANWVVRFANLAYALVGSNVPTLLLFLECL